MKKTTENKAIDVQLDLLSNDKYMSRINNIDNSSIRKLNGVIDWNIFYPDIAKAFSSVHKGPGGRPHYDYIMMFKVLVLQTLANLSDDQTELLILDRLTYRDFLGITSADEVPDAKTIWHFRETLSTDETMDRLFKRFYDMLELSKLKCKEGHIVDSTFYEVPRNRNTREENEAIKEGRVPEGWDDDNPKKKHMRSQKDEDARWTKKNKENHYGYKDHVAIDVETGYITGQVVTPANVYDGNVADDLVKQAGAKIVYGDSAYHADSFYTTEIDNRTCEKGYRNHPLTDEQKQNNRTKSKVRAKVEHVFAYMEKSMNGCTLRCRNMARARCIIVLRNLLYNMHVYELSGRKETCEG